MEKTSNSNSSAFDAWMKSQKDYFDTLTDVTEKFQTAMKSMDFTAKAAPEGADLAGLYRQWQETFGKYYEGLLKATPFAAGHGTVAKLFGCADTYVKLYEFWEPIAKAVQERAMSGKDLRELFDPEQYQEVLGKIFGFGSAAAAEEFAGQASRIVETLVSKSELFAGPWTEAVKKNMEAMAGMASGDADAGDNVFHNIYAAFEETFGKAFKMPAVGKDREKAELLLETMDKYSVFLARNAQYQQRILATGREAMEEVLSAYAEKIGSGEEVGGFDDFFQMWTSLQEKEYLALFNTDEFSQLQATVLESALDARSWFNKLMELFLSDYPLALRSEMDALYKTVYELKKSVRRIGREQDDREGLLKEIAALKRRVTALEGKGKAAKTTTTRSKTTKRASRKGAKK